MKLSCCQWFLVPFDLDFGTHWLWELEPSSMMAAGVSGSEISELTMARKTEQLPCIKNRHELSFNEIDKHLCQLQGASPSEVSIASASPSHGFSKISV